MLLVRTVILLCCLAFALSAVPKAEAQNPRERAALAANWQRAYRDEGCGGCRVWVTGKDSTVVNILDPEAETTPNDYQGSPPFWCGLNSGFREVIYYVSLSPRRVYARHKC